LAADAREIRAVHRRLILPALLLLAGFCGIVVRLWAMQVQDYEKYLREGQARLQESVPVRASRGDITDRSGRPLATSVITYRLGLTPSRCPDNPAFHAAIASAVGISPAKVGMILSGAPTVCHIVATGLSKEQAAELRAIARSWRADGLSLESVSRRVYANCRLASHVIGFVNEAGDALGGIEQAQNVALTGVDGVIVGPTDARGYVLPGHRERYTPARDGKTVRLTIDLDIQQAATEAIAEVVEKHTPSTVAVVVMEPHTGDVLAMVSWPDFDPNDPAAALRTRYRNENSSPLRNSCVSLAFPPGSVFKVFTVAAALEAGVVTPETQTYCAGVRKFGGRDTRCALHNGKRAHGVLNPYMTIVRSCNLAAGEYAQRLGAKRFMEFIHSFGCVDKTGIGLPGETRGLLPPPEKWGNPAHQLAVLGFGQSISVTPLALTAAMCTFANDGRTVRPRLVASVGGRENPVRPGKQVVSPEVARLVRQMLTGVVEDPGGTGHNAAVAGFHVGGKTGTAQRTDPITKRISNSLYDSYFVGLVPTENTRAVVLVLVDEPRNGYYGGLVAGPVFQKIASYLVTHWRLRPDATQNGAVQ